MPAGFATPVTICLLSRLGAAAPIPAKAPTAADNFAVQSGGRLIAEWHGGTIDRWRKRQALLRDDEEMLLILSLINE